MYTTRAICNSVTATMHMPLNAACCGLHAPDAVQPQWECYYWEIETCHKCGRDTEHEGIDIDHLSAANTYQQNRAT